MYTLYFYSKNSNNKEAIYKLIFNSPSRLKAARFFALIKGLSLKQFLSIYSISK